jgi:CreA protein
MRQIRVILIVLFLLVPLFAFAQNATQIGEVTAVDRFLDGNDKIKVIRIEDPDNPFVSIYFTTIKSGQIFAFADPSNTSIATRLTKTVPVDKDGKQIINKTHRTEIASVSKSIGTKEMKIARWYDPEKNTLIYLVYTDKWIGGSLKHSISAVALGFPPEK